MTFLGRELQSNRAQSRLQGRGVLLMALPARLQSFLDHDAQSFVQRVIHGDRRGVMINALHAPVLGNQSDVQIPGAALVLRPRIAAIARSLSV